MPVDDWLQRWPAWVWRRPAGAIIGLCGVLALTFAIRLFDRTFGVIPNPGLLFLLLILALAFVWGGRVGFVAAAAAFFLVWYSFVPTFDSFAFSGGSDWPRLILLGVTNAAMALVGDAFRRVRRANWRLQGTVERLNAIVVSIPDGVMILDRAGDLVQANEGMERLFGGPIPGTIDQRRDAWQTRLPDGSPMGSDGGPTFAALAGEITTGYEVTLRNVVGDDRHVSLSGAPIRGRGGQIDGAVIVFHDIAEVRRLQQVKDDFLSIASHELKTPLTSLRGYAQLLRQRFDREGLDDPRSRRYLATIDAQVRRMSELVDTLLDVTRLDAGRLRLQRQPCDLIALVREVVGQLGELTPRHTMTLVTDLPAIVGPWDRERIEQIVVNLLTNAVRYSPDGGTITVQIGTAGAADTGRDGAGSFAVMRVRDEGVGIAPDQLEAIFDRFHRIHEGALAGYAEAQRGMGLGLFISRELAQRHGGRLEAASPGPGCGSIFTLRLPLDSPDHADGVRPSGAK